ncbi:unnamed protein product [Mycena citricolor]|uniref:Uncharacterized protein n=1 Tax=Mycena citricolor TaxID=2018698 RepID=A0AAD2HN18_9AGAR|nr:unnamed protein product [Mycena citricolor]
MMPTGERPNKWGTGTIMPTGTFERAVRAPKGRAVDLQREETYADDESEAHQNTAVLVLVIGFALGRVL